MSSIYDLSQAELSEVLKEFGQPSFRALQVFSALHKGIEVADISNVPKSLREQLTEAYWTKLPSVVKEHISKDGTRKYLLDVDGNGTLIECVLLKQDYGNTVCVSTQVGCRMGCAFCASGKDGLVRNLTAGEILSQVLLLENLNPVKNKEGNERGITNIVLMGSGEPFDNFDNTVKFLRLVTAEGGINIGARNISVSTAGVVPRIRDFADLGMQVNLCISLHAANDDVRRRIMPIAKKYKIEELIDAAKYFFNKTKRRVIFEYSLIDGVNCDQKSAQELAKLLKGWQTHVNLINLNVAEGSEFSSPTRETAMSFMDALIKAGLSVTMRKSRGSDIAGACGQLRNMSIKK